MDGIYFLCQMLNGFYRKVQDQPSKIFLTKIVETDFSLLPFYKI